MPRLGWLLACLLLTACSGERFPEKESNELAALNHLRKFQTANAHHFAESGRYATLPELYRNGAGEDIEYWFFLAWDGHVEPKPFFGYLFASVDPGYASDRKKASRAGLCAYPAVTGETGDLIICTLSSGDPAVAGDAEEWRLYVAQAIELRYPPRAWPSEDELQRSFVPLSARSAEQGIAEAHQRALDALAGG